MIVRVILVSGQSFNVLDNCTGHMKRDCDAGNRTEESKRIEFVLLKSDNGETIFVFVGLYGWNGSN
jgi:hypothetical protein